MEPIISPAAGKAICYAVRGRNVIIPIMHGGIALHRVKRAVDGSVIKSVWRIHYRHQGTKFTISTDLNAHSFIDYGPNEGEAYKRALQLLATISQEIAAKRHDPEKYRPANKSKYSIANVMAAYYESRTAQAENKRGLDMHQLGEIRRYLGTYFVPAMVEKEKLKDFREIRTHHLENLLNRHLAAIAEEMNRKVAESGKKKTGRKYKTAWAPKTVCNLVMILNGLFAWTLRKQYIDRPVEMPDLPNVPETKIKWLNEEEQRAVVAAIPQQHRDIFEFMAWYGVRPSEARALQLGDIAFPYGYVMIQRAFNRSGELSTVKNKKIRSLPITADTAALIQRAATGKVGSQTFVFIDPDTSAAYTLKKLDYLWRRACAAAGLSVSLTEGTRKTVATLAINNGADENEISKALGNSPDVLRKHYAQVQAARHTKVFDRSAKVIPMPGTQAVPKGKK